MTTLNNMKTAVAYARYSTDMQNDRSIDDQVEYCKDFAARQGYKIVKVYSDRAKTSATMFDRDGLLSMMTSLRERTFDAIVTESLDRISRDQEDLAGIFKRVSFANAQIITPEGPATQIQVGVRGLLGPMFLKDLADKVRRGYNGRIRAGQVCGSPAYGHRRVAGKKHEQEIDPATAEIVRRIFREYVGRKRIREICNGLTRDGIPTPTGKQGWGHTTISGGGLRTRGIIGNRRYIGELVWGAYRGVRNPDTGKVVKRPTAPETVITVEVPHLRIIDQATWDAAQEVRAGRREQRASKRSGPRPAYSKTAKDHLLAGMLCCGECGGHMRIFQKDARVGCVAGWKGHCSHNKTYCLDALKDVVLHGIKDQLDVKRLVDYVEGYSEEWQRQQQAARAESDAIQKKLTNVQVKIERILNIMDEVDDLTELKDKLKKLSLEKAGLTESLKLAKAEISQAAAKPETIKEFRLSLEEMHATLINSDQLSQEEQAQVQIAFRNLFDRFVVLPTARRQPYRVKAYARLAAILGVPSNIKIQTPEEMLQEQGLGNLTFGKPATGG